MDIPNDLRTKEIKTYINDLIYFDSSKDFDSLDEIHKDRLCVLGLKAFGGDIDIVIGSEANHHLTSYLLSSDPDDQIELMHSLKESVHEKFSPYFNKMIEESREDIRVELLYYAGKKAHIDPINREVRYL